MVVGVLTCVGCEMLGKPISKMGGIIMGGNLRLQLMEGVHTLPD